MLKVHRLIVMAALTIAVALPSAAIAQQDLRSPDARDAAANAQTTATVTSYQDLRSPDARDAARAGLESSARGTTRQDLRSPDARDAARTVVVVPEPTAAVEPADEGFDWGDAAIGAAAILGIILLLGGGVMLVQHRRTVSHRGEPGH